MWRMINFLGIIEATIKIHLLENGYQRSKCFSIIIRIILHFSFLRIEEMLKNGDRKTLNMILALSMFLLLSERK